MRHIFHLANCGTCQRILKDWQPDDSFILQNIKTEAITAEQLAVMASLSGSYESLFSRIARKYRSMGLGEQKLTETDYKDLILSEYTFLKRPVLILDNQIFIGNSPKNVAAAKLAIEAIV